VRENWTGMAGCVSIFHCVSVTQSFYRTTQARLRFAFYRRRCRLFHLQKQAHLVTKEVNFAHRVTVLWKDWGIPIVRSRGWTGLKEFVSLCHLRTQYHATYWLQLHWCRPWVGWMFWQEYRIWCPKLWDDLCYHRWIGTHHFQSVWGTIWAFDQLHRLQWSLSASLPFECAVCKCQIQCPTFWCSHLRTHKTGTPS